MNELTKFLVDGVLNESVEQITALFGGGFKPPTKGHLDVVLNGLKQNPEINNLKIIVGGGVRDGITQDQSARIWELYRDIGFIPVETEIIKASPFNYYKEYLRSNPDSKTYVFIGSREGSEGDQFDFKQRSEFVKKYSDNVIPVEISTTGGISGTEARKLFKTDLESFKDMLPEKLTVGDIKRIVDILNGKSKDSTKNPSFDRTEPLSPLNEGRYDTISNKISSDIFKYWKDNITDRVITFTNTYQHEGEDIDVEATLKQTPEIEYLNVDGGADDETDYILVSFEVNPYELPQALKDISFNLKDVIRHEIEHLTHGEGFMSKSGKYMENDEMIRKMIDMEFLPKSSYFTLEKEVDANLQGMYFRAKKEKRPFRDVIDVYLNAQKITPEEKEKIINLWSKRTRALGLPSIEDEELLNEIDLKKYVDKAKGGFKKFIGALKQEGKETKEAFKLLAQSVKGEKQLSKEEKKEIGNQLKDVFKTVGYLGLFALPGGSIFTILFNLLKLNKYVLPSAFQPENLTENKNPLYYEFQIVITPYESEGITFLHYDGRLIKSSKNVDGDPLIFTYKNVPSLIKAAYKAKNDKSTITIWDDTGKGKSHPLDAASIKLIKKQSLTEASGDKILYAFDLDDTLITSNSSVIVTNPEQGTFKLTPAEYALYEPGPDDELDFSEFAYLKDPKVIKDNFNLFSQILNKSSKLSGAKTIILTARQPEVSTDVEAFLEQNNLPQITLHAVGSSDPNEKLKVIEDYIDQGFNKIRFYDDSPKNVKSIKSISRPGVDVVSKLVKHGPLSERFLNEAIVGDKIECDKCDWSWDIKDGGDDLYVCHKCGYDNEPLNESISPFSKNIEENILSDIKEYGGINEYKIDLKNTYSYNQSGDFFQFKDEINNLDVIVKLKPVSKDIVEFKFYPVKDDKPLGFIRLPKSNPKIMNTIFKIFMDEILPNNPKILIQPSDYTRYRLFRAMLNNNLDGSEYKVNTKDNPTEQSFLLIQKLNESKDPFGLIQFVNEVAEESEFDYTKHIDSLNDYMVKNKMNVSPLPKVTFIDDDVENANDVMGKTAYYDPNKREIVLYTLLRHPKDILRSYAHEMIHHIQNLEDRLGNITTTNTTEDDNLTAIEKEAYTDGNLTFRKWTETINEITNKEMRYWAFHGDIFSELREFGVKKYKELKKLAKGERLKAVEHFWDLLEKGKLTEYLAPQEEVRIFNENTTPVKNLKVYHSTDSKFEDFSLDYAWDGFWFTDDLNSLKNRTAGASGGKYILTRYITLKNPAGWDEYDQYSIGELINMGYDGVILPDPGRADYLVFSPKSITNPTQENLAPQEEVRIFNENCGCNEA